MESSQQNKELTFSSVCILTRNSWKTKIGNQMKKKDGTTINSSGDGFRVPDYLRDDDHKRDELVWQKALEDIRALAQKRKLTKKIFISYAWPTLEVERDELQQWLKCLQDNLERARIKVFYDVRNMQGHFDTTIKKNLQESDFIVLILTPKFLERVQNSSSKLAFEFKLTLEKAAVYPESTLPILYSGTLCEVVQGQLSPLREHLIYTVEKNPIESLLVELSNPLGLIPVIYGISPDDREYQQILKRRLNGKLTRLPLPLIGMIQRTTVLNQLRIAFQEDFKEKSVSIVVIQGMGGVGKTQLATIYADQWVGKQGFARWVYADPINLEYEWLRLGELLGLDLKGLDNTEQRRLIRYALQERLHWLIILDNLNSQDALAGLLPEKLLPTQQVLITTRSKNWGRLPVLSLSEFTLEESLDYCAMHLSTERCRGIGQLAKELGYLPLALSQAVAYMQQTGLDAEAYLSRYQKVGVALFGDPKIKIESHSMGYNHTVLTTWKLSIDELEKKDNEAAMIVRFCAYLYSENIEEYFLQILLDLDELSFDKCLRTIRNYGLLIQERNSLKIHRLVQTAIRYQESIALKDMLFDVRIKPVAQMLLKLYPHEKRTEDYLIAHSLQPHLEQVLKHLSVLDEKLENKDLNICRGALMAARADFFLDVSGEARRALQYYQEALVINLTYYAKESGEVATSYGNLGDTYLALGDAKAALECHQKGLTIRLKIYGEEHPYVAASYNGLGSAYLSLRNFQSAQECQEKALAIYLRIYGEAHPYVAKIYTNLMVVYQASGNAESVLKLHEKALAIYLNFYGEKHPEVAMVYYNLGNAYYALEDFYLAVDCYNKALPIILGHYGEEHPMVAALCNSVGSVLTVAGEIGAAVQVYEKALMIGVKLYGEYHYFIAEIYRSLGDINYILKDAKLALGFYEKALEIFLKVHDNKKHPSIMACYNALELARDGLRDVWH